MSRDEPRLRQSSDLPASLHRALDAAANDELPSAARFHRIEASIRAEVSASNARRPSEWDAEDWREPAPARVLDGSGERPSGWRTTPATPVRFAAAKMSIGLLACVAASWVCTVGYRFYGAAGKTAAATQEPPPVADPHVASTPAPQPAVAAEAPPADGFARPPHTAFRWDRALEEDLLERAYRALDSDPEGALAQTDDLRAKFPSGQLVQQREIVAIRALTKLGRFDIARARARQFIAEHPESIYAKELLELTGVPRR